MIIIVGLGNPERKYDGTRHNIGFCVVDALADENHIAFEPSKHKALVGKGVIGGQKVILAKPLTYMNLSGESVRMLMDFYKVDPTSEVIICYDDIALDIGKIRVRAKGSAGGHNGIKSIIAHLNTQDFMRVRVGVGEKPAKMDLADWVLSHFSKEETEKLAVAVKNATGAITTIITDGVAAAMNKYN